jgi:hypothetical protein
MLHRLVRWLCTASVYMTIDTSSLSCCQVGQRAAREGWLQADQGKCVVWRGKDIASKGLERHPSGSLYLEQIALSCFTNPLLLNLKFRG